MDGRRYASYKWAMASDTKLTVEDLPELDSAAVELITNPTNRTDPLAVFDRLREGGWAARSPRGVEVFSHAGAEAAYQNPDMVPGVTKIIADMTSESAPMSTDRLRMIGSEGADHTRYRRVVSRWFTPRRVEELRPRIRALVESLVEPITEAEGGDVMATVIRRVPGPVFCWMIGAPEQLGDRLFAYSEALISVFEADASKAQEIFEAGVEARALVDDLIAEKRRQPADDLLSIMLTAADGGGISASDARAITYELLAASTDNTAHAAGLALALLAGHPEQWDQLRADPSLVGTTVEECLRIEPRIRQDSRYTAGGATLLDLEVPPGTMVWLHTAGANGDPDVYPDPHRFDIARGSARPQLNFGLGRHFCMGAALARMELQEILGTFAARWSHIALDGEPEIIRRNVGIVRSLPLHCTPA